MRKMLNINNAYKAMETRGLSQTAVAEQLSVSKEAVSQWLKGKTYPRPNKLLALGKLLELSFGDLVISEEVNQPKVAFRKAAGTKTKSHHIENAQEIGRFLRHLVPFLPFDTLEMPPVLKNPSVDYEYLQRAAAKVREDINLSHDEDINFAHLIKRFYELQAVVVPVLWGAKQRHENAIHIYLPDSQSTWVYLNLDTNIHDFKFWMAHELGHCLSPNLEGDDAEDFADAFAGALLFPHSLAERAYKSIVSKNTTALKIREALNIADRHVISPVTVSLQANLYAKNSGLPEIDLGKSFFGAVANFNKKYKNVSETLFDVGSSDESEKPSARNYVTKGEESFDTPFFDMLRRYLKENNKGPGYVKSVLDMPLLDARGIHSELT